MHKMKKNRFFWEKFKVPVMMRKISVFVAMVVIAGIAVLACKPKVAPLSERIAKAWLPEAVKEGTATVYVKDGTNNSKPGYSSFRLTLGSGNVVNYVEFDNTTFTGKWELQGDKLLRLKELTPEPTETDGVIEFTINQIEDKKLVITRTKASMKTGNTINSYTLYIP